MAISGGVGVAIFIGFTLYDFSVLKHNDFEDYEVPVMAFNIFLNILNLILEMLKMLYYLKELVDE